MRNKKINKFKIFVPIGVFGVISLTTLSVIGCTNNKAKDLTYNEIYNLWTNKFKNLTNNYSNYSNFVQSNLSSSLNNINSSWLTFYQNYMSISTLPKVNGYIKIPINNNTNFYIKSFNIKDSGLSFNTNSFSFNVSLTWNMDLGFQTNNLSIDYFNLSLTDNITQAQISNTLILNLLDISQKNVNLYGAWYISYVASSIISYDVNGNLPSNISTILELIKNYENSNTDFSINNPTTNEWYSFSSFLPVLKVNNGLINIIENIYKIPKEFDSLISKISFGITGYAYINNEKISYPEIENVDYSYSKQLSEIISKYKEQTIN